MNYCIKQVEYHDVVKGPSNEMANIFSLHSQAGFRCNCGVFTIASKVEIEYFSKKCSIAVYQGFN